MNPIILYHANCTDGFTAAWIALRALGQADTVPAFYGTDPPDVKGREVWLLDFSYKRPVMESLVAAAQKLHILDHHKTAQEDLVDLEGAHIILDMKRSGAAITWDWFHNGNPRPRLVDYVQDRDLWEWKLPESRLVSAAIESVPRTFTAWDELCERSLLSMISDGRVIESYRKQCIEDAAGLARLFYIGDVWVPTANCSEMRFASDIAHTLAANQPFAATYWVRADGIVQFSLRSREDGTDVSEIARRYGGGGHKHAAGFQVNIPTFHGMLVQSDIF